MWACTETFFSWSCFQTQTGYNTTPACTDTSPQVLMRSKTSLSLHWLPPSQLSLPCLFEFHWIPKNGSRGCSDRGRISKKSDLYLIRATWDRCVNVVFWEIIRSASVKNFMTQFFRKVLSFNFVTLTSWNSSVEDNCSKQWVIITARTQKQDCSVCHHQHKDTVNRSERQTEYMKE